MAWSLDHLGLMTRTAMDAALMLQVIAGYDPEDTNSTDTPVQNYAGTLVAKTSSLRIGIPRVHFYEERWLAVSDVSEPSALPPVFSLAESMEMTPIPLLTKLLRLAYGC